MHNTAHHTDEFQWYEVKSQECEIHVKVKLHLIFDSNEVVSQHIHSK